MSFFGNIGQDIVRAAPAANQILAQRAQIGRQQDQQNILNTLANRNATRQDDSLRLAQDRNAQSQAIAQQKATDNTHLIDARVKSLGGPKVMRGPGGQLLDVSDPSNPQSVGPGPATKPTAQRPLIDPVTGKVNFYDPTNPPQGLKLNPKPRPDAQPTITVLPGTNGGPAQGVVTHGPGIGSTIPIPGVTKTAAGGGGGASLAPEDRAKMLSQAKLDNQTMKDYENKVMQSGKAPGTVAGLAGAAAGSQATGLGSQAISILGNRATGMVDPDFQRYITAQKSYGRIMGNLQSKRYTDHQAEIERSISGLQGNDLTGTIQYKQALRDASLAEPSAGTPAGASPSAPTSAPTPPKAVKTVTPTAQQKKDYGIFGGANPPQEEEQ